MSRINKSPASRLKSLLGIGVLVIGLFSATYAVLNFNLLRNVTKATENMQSYWQLYPGNYWILKGYNYQQNKPVTTKIEVEEEVSLAGNCYYQGKNIVMPLRFTKDHYSAYWGMNNWKNYEDTELYNMKDTTGHLGIRSSGNINLRFMMVSPHAYPSGYFYSAGEKIYMRDQSEPFADIGQLRTSEYFRLNSGNPPYTYSRYSYSSPSSFTDWFYYNQSLVEFTGNTCNAVSTGGYNITDRMTGKSVNVSTPAYSGPAFVSIQAEQNTPRTSYSTREDWYLGLGVGFARLVQKDFSQPSPEIVNQRQYGGDNPKFFKNEPPYQSNPSLACLPATLSSCRCDNVLNYSGPDYSCAKTGSYPNLIQNTSSARPMIDQSLVKYYLGWKLKPYVANNHYSGNATTISVPAGTSFELRVSDTVKHFTYEGFVVANGKFFRARDGKITTGNDTKVFMEDGRAMVYVSDSIPAGSVYTVSFRPLISSMNGANGETRTGYVRSVPWSDPVTIKVTSKPSGWKLITSDRYSLITSTKVSNNPFYPEPGSYEPVDARNIVRNGNNLEERVYQGTRYFMRSSSNNGASWGNWYTNTLWSAWNNGTSNMPTIFPHPDVTMPVDAYTLDYNNYFKRFEERVYQGQRYYMRSGPTLGTLGSWFTGTYASAWGSDTGTGHPNPYKKVLGTSFTYTSPGVFTEEVIQDYKIYRRTFRDNFTGFSSWTQYTTPIDQTLDLKI